MPPESSSSHRHQAIFKSIEASHIHCNGIITCHKETKDWTGQHSDRGALQGCRDVSTRRTQPRTPPPLPGCIHPLLTPPTHHRWQVTRTHSDGQDGRAPLRLRRHDSPIHRIKVRHSHTSRNDGRQQYGTTRAERRLAQQHTRNRCRAAVRVPAVGVPAVQAARMHVHAHAAGVDIPASLEATRSTPTWTCNHTLQGRKWRGQVPAHETTQKGSSTSRLAPFASMASSCTPHLTHVNTIPK